MAEIKFGKDQFSNPTPTKWANVVQVFTVLAGVTLAWVGTASFIPLPISGVIQSILGLLIGMSNGLLPFLGVQTDKKSVPVEEVSAMKAE